jgi:hypothetical protein
MPKSTHSHAAAIHQIEHRSMVTARMRTKGESNLVRGSGFRFESFHRQMWHMARWPVLAGDVFHQFFKRCYQTSSVASVNSG